MQHLMHKWWLLIASAGLMASCQKGPAEAIPGQELPQWKEGWLDIHSINGARGESFWYIFPDGTTLLVDAGGVYTELYRTQFAKALENERERAEGLWDGVVLDDPDY